MKRERFMTRTVETPSDLQALPGSRAPESETGARRLSGSDADAGRLVGLTRFVLRHRRIVTGSWVAVTLVGMAGAGSAYKALSGQYTEGYAGGILRLAGNWLVTAASAGVPRRFRRINSATRTPLRWRTRTRRWSSSSVSSGMRTSGSR